MTSVAPAGFHGSAIRLGAAAWFDTRPDDELLIALHDGTVKQSADAGRSWSVRSEPD
jgi:hypothetical protein